MLSKSPEIYLFVVLLFAPMIIFGQSKQEITSDSRIKIESISANQCKDLRLGQILTLPEPKYPSKAKSEKIGGTIEITVKIDENGNVFEIEKISGAKILQETAIEAALKAKFVPTLCDGKKVRVSGVIVFRFYPFPRSEIYTTPKTIADFADVTIGSQFYSVIYELTENYKISFGYADGNFHAETALTRGDFVQFLRLTLEMLSEKAKSSNKNLAQLDIYNSYNPQKISSIGKIKNLKTTEPYYNSIKILLQNYEIALVDENSEFRGNQILTQNELIEIWTEIFRAEAIPVNFERTENFQRTLSRGDFALFLNESLGILIYKLMP
ncbi:hypothetical protein BH10ACI1_BH10ACI1_28190 [soil metagenome]